MGVVRLRGCGLCVPIGLSEEEDEDEVVLEPSRKRCKLASEIALRV